jgi:hypothetical protein
MIFPYLYNIYHITIALYNNITVRKYDNIYHKKNTENLIDADKDVGLEVNTEK